MTSAAADPRGLSDHSRVVWFAVAVAVIAAIPFLPALRADFVTWDDDRNFLRNGAYRGLGLAQLKWMWTTYHMGHYVPLSWMTLGLDYVLWGMDARGYHLTNIVLHAANVVVLFFVARRVLSLALREDRDSAPVMWGAAFAALIFAVHPLRVESVAWVTERRDVLSGLLFSLTVLVYLRAAGNTPMTSRQFAPVFALCFAALLAKATAMTLPAVVLLLNVYPLRRLSATPWSWSSARAVFREVAPLALLSVAAMLMSLRALPARTQLDVADKLAVSAYGVSFYVWKTVLPIGLGPLYPMPQQVPIASPAYLASIGVVSLVALFAVLQWKRWPGAVAAIAGFLLVVLPMLGLVQNGPQVAADRYTYHAAPAIALLLGAGFALAWRRRRIAAATGGALVLAALGSLTWIQTGYWHDSMALWKRAVHVADDSGIAHNGLGTVYFLEDSITPALEQYRRAVQVSPFDADARVNIAVCLARLGRYDEAPQYFIRALELRPDFDGAENSWGVVMAMQGKQLEAIGHYQLALAINPDNAEAELNWGNALVAGRNPAASLPHYQRAAELSPFSVEIEARWGATLAQIGKLDEAIPHFRRAVALDPKDERAHKLLDRALSERASPPKLRS